MEMNDSNKKIGIVMTYYNRQYQLNKTLETINMQKYGNLIVVIVDDKSDCEIILPKCDFEVKIIRIGDEKKWTNPEPAYNRGILYLIENTDAEIIINQNAESYHVGNVLEYASINTTLDNYIAFGCYSINKFNTFNPSFNVLNFINIIGNDHVVFEDRENGWYNHPIRIPSAFEFCSSIHRDNMIKLNGYDERFSYGHACGDAHLVHRIKLLGLKIEITTNPIVVHQWHDYSYKGADASELRAKNGDLLSKLTQEKNVKGVHLFNKDFN